MNKGGWIHILEATIAVLIVAGVMVTIYDDQSAREFLSVEDYSYSLQNEILEEIATRSDLRVDVLKVVVDLPGDPAYDELDSFVEEKTPENFGHVLRVCNLGDPNDYCKMDPMIFYATMENDVYVEEVVISAEVGDGNDAEYSPKKVRLFLWEGGFPEDYCMDECTESRFATFCSQDFSQVLKNVCGNFNTSDICNESGADTELVEDCSLGGQTCDEGECVSGLEFSKLLCEKWEFAYSLCEASPVCPNGYDYDSTSSCVLPGVCTPMVWSPAVSEVCYGVSFTQTDGCSVQSATGTKNCPTVGWCGIYFEMSTNCRCR